MFQKADFKKVTINKDIYGAISLVDLVVTITDDSGSTKDVNISVNTAVDMAPFLAQGMSIKQAVLAAVKPKIKQWYAEFANETNAVTAPQILSTPTAITTVLGVASITDLN